jgi:hypothetical protein
MDADPELDVTLSDGRQSITFQIAAVQGALEAWTVVEPLAPLRVMLGHAEALAARSRLDQLIAARLEAGWVPVDGSPDGARAAPIPLSSDLVLQIGGLVEALDGGRAALRAADPTGQLWAACVTFLRQARRFGMGAPQARVTRAQRERRLGELAEQAGDILAAMLHYRAALAVHAAAGVKRRLTSLERHWSHTRASEAPDQPGRRGDDGQPARAAAEPGTGRAIDPSAVPSGIAVRGRTRSPHRRVSGAQPHQEDRTMPKKGRANVQLVCRIDRALSDRVRSQAARAGQTLTTFVARALEKAAAGTVTPAR